MILMSLLCTVVGMAAGAVTVHAWHRAALEDETARADRYERLLVTARHPQGDDPTGKLLADVRADTGRHRKGVRRG